MNARAIQEEGGFSMGMSVKETYVADIMWWQIFKMPGGMTERESQRASPQEKSNLSPFEHPKKQNIFASC